MSVQWNLYHSIVSFIPPQQIKRSHASIFANDTDEVERETIGCSHINQHLGRSILTDLGTTITQTSTYAQTFQSLDELAYQDAPDDYSMVIHADKHPASKYARRYIAPEPSEVAEIILGV